MLRLCSASFGTLLIALLASASASAAIITTAGDPIVGFWNTVVGGNSTTSTAGTGQGQYPAGEPPAMAIDGIIAGNNKYLNFGSDASGVSNATKGVGTGFYVTPSSGASILKSIRIGTANDAPNRDPLTIAIEGSNAVGAALDLGASWTLIANNVNLGIGTDPGRNTFAAYVPIVNFTSYTSYRIIVLSQRGSDNSTQYAEIELNTTAVPEPTSLALVGLGGALLAGCVYRRRGRK